MDLLTPTNSGSNKAKRIAVLRTMNPSIEELKRLALLFDCIAVPGLDWWLDGGLPSSVTPHADIYYLAELSRLRDRRIIVDPLTDGALNTFPLLFIWDEHSKIDVLKPKGDSRILPLGRSVFEEEFCSSIATLVAHKTAIWYVEGGFENAVANVPADALAESVLSKSTPDATCANGDIKSQAQLWRNGLMVVSTLRATLQHFPVTTEGHSWEQVEDFRADSDSQKRLLELRRWLRKAATEITSESELDEEISYLLARYEDHMRVHKLKFQRGFIESTIVGTAEVLEHTARLRFGKLVEKLFQARAVKTAIAEAELNAPGREVSFIAKAHDRFGPRG